MKLDATSMMFYRIWPHHSFLVWLADVEHLHKAPGISEGDSNEETLRISDV